jgi:membrane protease YdiL (CAAX protease family)
MIAMTRQKRLTLALEFLLIYAAAPAAVLHFRSRVLMIGLLWGAALCMALYLKHRRALGFRADWNWPALKAGLPLVLARFAGLAVVFVLAAWLILPPAHLFGLPLHAPWFWLLIMVFYPVLSVVPQEEIYRSFLRHRYGGIFGDGLGFIAVSGLAFGFAHIILLNPYVVGVTFLGGLMIADTYRRSRSLALVCLEHALYGCLLFTLGFGMYFYTGAAWHS